MLFILKFFRVGILLYKNSVFCNTGSLLFIPNCVSNQEVWTISSYCRGQRMLIEEIENLAKRKAQTDSSRCLQQNPLIKLLNSNVHRSGRRISTLAEALCPITVDQLNSGEIIAKTDRGEKRNVFLTNLFLSNCRKLIYLRLATARRLLGKISL